MISKKYVVTKGNYYSKTPFVVCDSREDAEDVARRTHEIEDVSEYVFEVMYIRSKQTVARDFLYDMQNGITGVSRHKDEVADEVF